MPIELIWSNQARTDLLEIYVMIGLEQPAVAFDHKEANKHLGKIVVRLQPLAGCRYNGLKDN